MKYHTRTEATMLTGMASAFEPAWNELVQLAESKQPAPGKVTVELRGLPVHMELTERGKVQTWKIAADSFENMRIIAGEYPPVPKGRQWLSMTNFAQPPAILGFEKARPLWQALQEVAAPVISPEHHEATVQLGGRDIRTAMFKAQNSALYVHKDSIENLLRFHAEEQAAPGTRIDSIVHKGMQALENKKLPGRSGA